MIIDDNSASESLASNTMRRGGTTSVVQYSISCFSSSFSSTKYSISSFSSSFSSTSTPFLVLVLVLVLPVLHF